MQGKQTSRPRSRGASVTGRLRSPWGAWLQGWGGSAVLHAGTGRYCTAARLLSTTPVCGKEPFILLDREHKQHLPAQ